MNTHSDDGSLNDEVVIHLSVDDSFTDTVESPIHESESASALTGVFELGKEDTRKCKCWPRRWRRLINVET